MRNVVNAIVNVIRRDNRRNRVIGVAMTPVMANGVDALRASGPDYSEHDRGDYRQHHHAPSPGQLGLERLRGLGLLSRFRLQQCSGLVASSAWRSLSSKASKRAASQCFTGSRFTATCTATTPRPSAAGRCEPRVAPSAARVLASA